MEYILLFDAQCERCNSLANQVKAIAKNRVDVRSLYEPEMQELLDQNSDGWQWEPKLLILNGEEVQVLSGISLSLTLLRILGVQNSFKILSLITKEQSLDRRFVPARRTFLLGMSTTLAAGMLGKFGRRSQQGTLDIVVPQGVQTEEYGGFLIYSDYLVDVTNSSTGSARLFADEFASVQAAAALSPVPLYMLGDLPLTSRQGEVYIYRNESDEMVSASAKYQLYQGESPEAVKVIILTNRDFPKPFPIFPTHEWEDDESLEPILRPPDKVSYTPTEGLLMPSVYGYTIKWIADDVLYSVVVEGRVPDLNLAETVVKSLQIA